tara:strand:+ start:823 stop:1437 length:615 start_codon:yes stop_codon:yes gene_type:complete
MTDKKQILKFFPQPIFKYKIDRYQEWNAQLLDYIYELKEDHESGIERSNINGWHSKPFDLKKKNSIQHKFFLNITKYVFDVLKNYGWKADPEKIICSEMWAIINKKNNFNLLHTHPNSYLSAAYYVKAPKNSGNFIIEDPLSVSRHSYPIIETKTEFNTKVAGLDIEEGDLLIFPAYLPHKVGKNNTDEDRVVVSFNININNFR